MRGSAFSRRGSLGASLSCWSSALCSDNGGRNRDSSPTRGARGLAAQPVLSTHQPAAGLSTGGGSRQQHGSARARTPLPRPSRPVGSLQARPPLPPAAKSASCWCMSIPVAARPRVLSASRSSLAAVAARSKSPASCRWLWPINGASAPRGFSLAWQIRLADCRNGHSRKHHCGWQSSGTGRRLHGAGH